MSYYIGLLTGYFGIMMLFMVSAIVFAKTRARWYLFIIGAILQLVSLIGRQRMYSSWGFSNALMTYWVVYFIILFITWLIILLRNKNQ